MKTRKWVVEHLGGLPEDVVEKVVKTTAWIRHQERKIQAIIAAAIAADGSRREDEAARALLWLEYEICTERGHTPRTQRLSPFVNLGKGRRHAIDGPAWTAAIGDAFHATGTSYFIGPAPAGCRFASRKDENGTNRLVIEVGYDVFWENVKSVDVETDLGLTPSDVEEVALFAARVAARKDNAELLRTAAEVYHRAKVIREMMAAAAAAQESATAD